MKRRNIPQKKKNESAAAPKRQRDPIPWRYCFLTLICGSLLVGGFFLAARQHFSAIDFGIKNARLRQQKENLEAEQQRHKLTREMTLSPDAIKKAARKIGLREMTASNIEIFKSKETAPATTTATANEKTLADKSNQNSLTPTTVQRLPDGRAERIVKTESKNEKKTTAPKNEAKKPDSRIDKKGDNSR